VRKEGKPRRLPLFFTEGGGEERVSAVETLLGIKGRKGKEGHLQRITDEEGEMALANVKGKLRDLREGGERKNFPLWLRKEKKKSANREHGGTGKEGRGKTSFTLHTREGREKLLTILIQRAAKNSMFVRT